MAECCSVLEMAGRPRTGSASGVRGRGSTDGGVGQPGSARVAGAESAHSCVASFVRHAPRYHPGMSDVSEGRAEPARCVREAIWRAHRSGGDVGGLGWSRDGLYAIEIDAVVNRQDFWLEFTHVLPGKHSTPRHPRRDRRFHRLALALCPGRELQEPLPRVCSPNGSVQHPPEAAGSISLTG